MQNFISFVNEQLRWEQESPHRHDCHDPPHTAGMEFLDDRSPPRRLPAVARSGPWKATPAEVAFPGDAVWRQRLLWVVGSDLSANNTGEGWRRESDQTSQRNCQTSRACHPTVAKAICG